MSTEILAGMAWNGIVLRVFSYVWHHPLWSIAGAGAAGSLGEIGNVCRPSMSTAHTAPKLALNSAVDGTSWLKVQVAPDGFTQFPHCHGEVQFAVPGCAICGRANLSKQRSPGSEKDFFTKTTSFPWVNSRSTCEFELRVWFVPILTYGYGHKWP